MRQCPCDGLTEKQKDGFKCQLCNSDLCVEAHRYEGKESDDNLIAALCLICHSDIARWPEEQRQQVLRVAHFNTVQALMGTD